MTQGIRGVERYRVCGICGEIKKVKGPSGLANGLCRSCAVRKVREIGAEEYNRIKYLFGTYYFTIPQHTCSDCGRGLTSSTQTTRCRGCSARRWNDRQKEDRRKKNGRDITAEA